MFCSSFCSSMLATSTMAACVTVCSACLLLAVLGFHFATRNPPQTRLNVKASRIQVFTDNSSHSSKNLTRSSQRPILQETYLANNSNSRDRWAEKGTKQAADTSTASDNPTQSEVTPGGPNLQLDQTFKMKNDSQ